MSTLERSKAYDATLNPRHLGDSSVERINRRTPHQAPQRERVSLSLRPRQRSSIRGSSPAGQQSSRSSPTSAADVRTWQDYMSPDFNMGVPTLLMLLEPNVVWRHGHDHTRNCSQGSEAAACHGSFFEGHDQISKLVRLLQQQAAAAAATAVPSQPYLTSVAVALTPKKASAHSNKTQHKLQQLRRYAAAADADLVCEQPVMCVQRLCQLAYALLHEAIPTRPHYFSTFYSLQRWHVRLQVHGVYEGSYWQLLGDLAELEAMLSRMTKAPALLEEPALQLPAEPELPPWEQYKPDLVPLPEEPAALAAIALPRFVEPDLPTSVSLPPPELLPVPPLPAPWKEVVAASFTPPPVPKSEPLQLPELLLPNALVLKEPAKLPPTNPPKHGHDWSGKRPFTVVEPVYVAPQLPPAPEEVLSELEAPQLQEAQLRLKPEPLLKLSWHGGLNQSHEYQAGTALQQQQQQQWLLGADAGVQAPDQEMQQQCNSSSRDGKAITAGAVQLAPGNVTTAGNMSKQLVCNAVHPESMEQLHVAWKEVESAPPEDSGAPHVWLDFKPPFADQPPVFLPPKPEPGPEPQLELPTDLQEPPVYAPPVPQSLPEFTEPPLTLPNWAAPCEPLPVGFLRGTAPVLIMDVSGTMHPAHRGQFLRVKRCICELLEPAGELATAGTAFDVLAFSGACWSFSAAYEGKKALIASAMQGSYDTERQAGRRTAGQLLPHSTTVSRSRVHQQRQQLYQRWQQQAQQARPSTAPAQGGSSGRVDAERSNVFQESQLCPKGNDDSRVGTNQQVQIMQGCQQSLADHPVPRNRRPGTANPVGKTEQQQQQLCHADGLAGVTGTYQSWLQATDSEHLSEAQSWVRNWLDAVGSTKLLTALITVHQSALSCGSNNTSAAGNAVNHETVDCYYLFSDGLADDAAACLDWVQRQAEAGEPLRPVHTVGFFPRNGCPSGERFLSQLAAITGGSYQVYNADLAIPAAAAAIMKNAAAGSSQNVAASKAAAAAAAVAGPAKNCTVGVPRVWDSELGGFVAVDLASEDAATRDERLWAEQQLKTMRLANKRSKKMQSLAGMVETLRQQHLEQRVLPAIAAHQNRLLQLRAAHTAACTAIQRNNELATRQALRNHAAAVQHVKEENERKVTAAHQAYAAAVQQWRCQHQEALAAWETVVAEAQAAAKAAAEAAEAAQLAAATVALQKQWELGQQELQQQQQQHKNNAHNSAAVDAVGSVIYRSSSSNSDKSIGRSSNHAGLGAAIVDVGASQCAVAVTPNDSLCSFIGADVSAGPDREASLLNITSAADDTCKQLSTEQTSQATVSVTRAGGTHQHTVSADDLLSVDPASAKLAFPLPSVHESQSHSSVSGWGGTPRLPQFISPGSAAAAAAAISSNIAAAGAGSSQLAAGNVSIAAAVVPAPRPKSAAARVNADRGSSAARLRGLKKAQSRTEGGSADKQGVNMRRPMSAGEQSRTDPKSRPKSASRSSTDGGTVTKQVLPMHRAVSAGGHRSNDLKPRPRSRNRSSTEDGTADKRASHEQQHAAAGGQIDSMPRPKSAAVRRKHIRAVSESEGGGNCRNSSKRRGSTSAAGTASAAGTRSPGSRPASAPGAAAKPGSRSESAKRHRRPQSSKSKSHSTGVSSDGGCDPRLGSNNGSTDCTGTGWVGSSLVDLTASAAAVGPHEHEHEPTLTHGEKLLSHILAVDTANRQALVDMYEAWREQAAEAEEHNTAALELHQHARRLHAEKLAAYQHQKQLWDKQVRRLEAAAKQAFDQLMAEAALENAKLAQLHDQEVQEKLLKERSYAKALADHAAAQAAADNSHQAAVAAAKAEHTATVAAAKQHWQQQQVCLEQAYKQQLEEAQQQHGELVQEVKEQNKTAREAYKQAAEAYRAATVENKRRLILAEEQLAGAQAKLAADNETELQQARQDHKLLCQHLQEAHQQHMQAVHQEWLAAKAAVQHRNDEALAAARARYAAAVEQAMQQHQAACEQLRQQHAADVAQIRARNEDIMPQVQEARLAATELARVKTFAAHIRQCAAKMHIGVNFQADTPNLGRVVEMAALTDGLQAAFPEVKEPRDYPWPGLRPPQKIQLLDAELHQQLQPQQAGGVVTLHQWSWQQQLTQRHAGSLLQQYQSRPSTAPPAGKRAASGGSSSAYSSSNNHSKASWRAKSPTTINFQLALQDPSVLLRQLQQSQTRTLNTSSRSPWQSLAGSSSARGDISSRCMKCPSLSGQQSVRRRPHTACAISGTSQGKSVGWGRVDGSPELGMLHGLQSSVAAAQLQPGGLIAAAGPAWQKLVLQQPTTASPSCQDPNGRAATQLGRILEI